MMNISETNPEFLGYWVLEDRAIAPFCFALRIYADPRGLERLFADVLYWHAGQTGCDSRSSDINTIPVKASGVDGNGLRLEATIDRTTGEAIPATLELMVEGNNISCELMLGGRPHDIKFRRSPKPFPTPEELPQRLVVD